MSKKTCAAFVVAILAACAETPAAVTMSDMVIDERFGEGELTWDNGIRLRYRVGIFEEDGNYLICAAIQNLRNARDRRAFAALKVVADGQTIQRGLTWARAYPTLASLDGKEASCRLTPFAASENPEIRVELTRRRF